MKKIVFVFVTLFLIFGCENTTDKKIDKKIKIENLVEVKDGVFTEWYPGKKALNFKVGKMNLEIEMVNGLFMLKMAQNYLLPFMIMEKKKVFHS